MADRYEEEGTSSAGVTPERLATSGEVVSGDDVSDAYKDTLANYLSRLTRGQESWISPNAIPVAPASDDIELRRGDGKPAGIIEPQNLQQTFLKQSTPEGSDYVKQLSRGGDPRTRVGGFFVPENLNRMIDKNSQRDGNTLLSSIRGNGLNTYGGESNPSQEQVPQETLNVLSDNRFSSPRKRYIEDGDYSKGLYRTQNQLGVYDPTDTQKGTTIEELSKIGTSLLFAASGIDVGTDPDNFTSEEAIAAGFEYQLGIADVDTENLRARNAAGAPNTNNLESDINLGNEQASIEQAGLTGRFSSRRRKYGKSSGAVNNPEELFAGAFPASMFAKAAIGAGLVAGGAAAVSLILGLLLGVIGRANEGIDPENPSTLNKGSSNGFEFGTDVFESIGDSTASALVKILGLHIPRYKGKNVQSVVLLYPFLSIIGTIRIFSRITDSPGYYMILARQVLSDLDEIADAFSGISNTNFVEGSQALFTALEALLSSTTYKFVNVSVEVGDVVAVSGGLTGGSLNQFSQVQRSAKDGGWDGMSVNVGSLHKKSRTYPLGSPDRRLIWRSTSLPSLHLLPKTLIAANQTMDVSIKNPLRPLGLSAIDRESKLRDSENGRISAEDVQATEDALDAYYCPFYFHDLRTNEIVAFHSFIESYTDNFTPTYNTYSGFGRVDDIHMYNKTTRSISITFKVAATNPKDYDEMWYMINRLVAMVYPQWSAGDIKQDVNGNKFTVPFSQVMTATPLIRIRLGDMMTSNASTKGLARLFGAGTENFDISGDTVINNGEISVSAEESAILLQKLTNEEIDPDSIFSIFSAFGIDTGTEVTVSAGRYHIYNSDQLKLEMNQFTGVIKGTKNMGSAVYYEVAPNDSSVADNIKSQRGLLNLLSSDVVLVPQDKLTFNSTQFAAALDALEDLSLTIATALQDNQIETFLNEQPVIRSFESNRGRGLAGVIDNLSFNWGIAGGTGGWVMEGPGTRAPSIVSVTIGFKPVHDIPPGLDATGEMRSSVFKAGSIMSELGGDPYGRSYADAVDAYAEEAAKSYQPSDNGSVD